MSTPEGNLETALDDSNDAEDRERAIEELQTANECDMLAEVARTQELADRYRELALETLAHPQCDETLAELTDDDALPESLRERAASLLEDVPDDSGAGP